MATFTLTHVNLCARNPVLLARFYARLMGWVVEREDPGFVVVRDPAGGVGPASWSTIISGPVWPAGSEDQQLQLTLKGVSTP
jgi:hypothetical protein